MPDLRVGWWQLWVPATFAVLLEIFLVSYSDGAHFRKPELLEVFPVAIRCIALVWRLRHPVAVTVLSLTCAVLIPLAAPHAVILNVAAAVSLFTVATLGDRRTTWALTVIAAVSLTMMSVLWLPDHLSNITTVLPLNYTVIAVLAGLAVKNRRAYLGQVEERAALAERTREQEAQRRVYAERIRIAQDLHDVVAHHITVVNAQAGVAHHLMRTHPDRAYEVLDGIRENSRAALDELRATVGLLRQDDDAATPRRPAPQLEDLEELLASVRLTGFDVRLARHGEPREADGATQLVAYRIVQEAVTNAGKHATVAHAEITLAYTDQTLTITVTNQGRPGHRGDGTGHGLMGMRERSTVVGGTLTAGFGPDGVFTVRAQLPLRPHHPAREPASPFS